MDSALAFALMIVGLCYALFKRSQRLSQLVSQKEVEEEVDEVVGEMRGSVPREFHIDRMLAGQDRKGS